MGLDICLSIMMDQERFNLTWQTYTDHLREMLHNMMTSEELTDVTLVTEDKKQFKAHKVVLSASSPIFKSIISENCTTNPLIYLRGIQSHEIESILQFIYLGEATFYQDRTNEFLNVAKSLEIKEISKDIENPEFKSTNNVENHTFEQNNDFLTSQNEPDQSLENNDKKPRQINSHHTIIMQQDSKYSCNQCPKQFNHQGDIKRHKRSAH